MIRELAPAELSRWRADPGRPAPLVVDVREPWELERCALSDSVHVPMHELPARLAEWSGAAVPRAIASETRAASRSNRSAGSLMETPPAGGSSATGPAACCTAWAASWASRRIPAVERGL